MTSPEAAQSKHAISDPNTWVDQYGDFLYRYALMRMRNKELAENVVQETFLAALTAKDKFSGKSTERTWLVGILKHKVIDHFRKGYKEKAVSELQNTDEAIDSFFDYSDHLRKRPQDWSPEPQQLLENTEFWKVFRMCLGKLPEATARVFAMRELDKIESKEICKELDISATNLWVMLHRARAQLRLCLESNWFEKI